MISTKHMNEFEIIDKVVQIEKDLNTIKEVLIRMNYFLVDSFGVNKISKNKKKEMLKINLKDLNIL